MPRKTGWGRSWSGGEEREGSSGGVTAVIRQVLEVVPGGILRAGKTLFGVGVGLVDRAGRGRGRQGGHRVGESVSAVRRC